MNISVFFENFSVSPYRSRNNKVVLIPGKVPSLAIKHVLMSSVCFRVLQSSWLGDSSLSGQKFLFKNNYSLSTGFPGNRETFPRTHVSRVTWPFGVLWNKNKTPVLHLQDSGSFQSAVWFFLKKFFLQSLSSTLSRDRICAGLHSSASQSIYFLIYPSRMLVFFCLALKSSVSSPPKRCLCTAQINRNPELQCFICHGLNFSKSGIYK